MIKSYTIEELSSFFESENFEVIETWGSMLFYTTPAILLNELFGDLDFPLIRDFLAGFETKITTHEGEKCRILRGRTDALYGNLVIEFERGAT